MLACSCYPLDAGFGWAPFDFMVWSSHPAASCTLVVRGLSSSHQVPGPHRQHVCADKDLPPPLPNKTQTQTPPNTPDYERNGTFKLIPHCAKGSWILCQTVRGGGGG